MKFSVDQELCIGCGTCEKTCPEVFELQNDKSQVKIDPVPEEHQASALDAEEACPVGAISHVD
jgi:ferredoxin